jgi:large subunit ribosomal protein L7/L12
MSKTSKSTLERLKEQRAKLEARIQAAEARTKQAGRKQDTRRKILVGSYYLDKALEENKFNELKKLMDGYLTRDSDRKLFELHLKPATQE